MSRSRCQRALDRWSNFGHVSYRPPDSSYCRWPADRSNAPQCALLGRQVPLGCVLLLGR